MVSDKEILDMRRFSSGKHKSFSFRSFIILFVLFFSVVKGLVFFLFIIQLCFKLNLFKSSFIYIFIYSYLHLFLSSFIYIFIYLSSFIPVFIYLYLHLFISLFIYTFTYSYFYLFVS